jgi:ketopantoate reductase
MQAPTRQACYYLVDAQRGQPIEVEVIFGEVVRLAREYQVTHLCRSIITSHPD